MEAKLRKLGLELPEVKNQAGLSMYLPNGWEISSTCPDKHLTLAAFCSTKGVVGEDMSIETAQQAAQLAALNILAVLKLDLGDLDRIRQIVQVVGYVRCAKGFEDQPKSH